MEEVHKSGLRDKLGSMTMVPSYRGRMGLHAKLPRFLPRVRQPARLDATVDTIYPMIVPWSPPKSLLRNTVKCSRQARLWHFAK